MRRSNARQRRGDKARQGKPADLEQSGARAFCCLDGWMRRGVPHTPAPLIRVPARTHAKANASTGGGGDRDRLGEEKADASTSL